MNKNLIYQAIQNPEVLVNLATADLERLTQEHPWFSAAHVLLAKKYQMSSDYRFTDQLHTAAMLSGNRTLLYRYLHQKEEPVLPIPPTLSSEVVEQSTSTEIHIEEAEELDDLIEQQEAFFDIFVDQKSASEPLEGNAFEKEAESQEADTLLGTLADRILAEEGEDATPTQEMHAFETDRDPLPDLLPPSLEEKRESAVAEDSNRAVEESPELHEVPKTFDDLDREILVNALHKSIEMEVSEPEQDDEDGMGEQSIRTTQTLADEEQSASSDPYTAWLLRRSREIHYSEGTSAEQATDEQKNTPQAPANTQPAEPEASQGVSHGVDRLKAPDKTRHQRDLIDRFIQQEPKISQGKASDYAGVSFGKESLEDSLGLVTETMAKLYAAQGKLDKARKAYKRLIELHPEKSVYFAAQLKNLNTKK
jgi:tetratricopeptide (TPR) repeat protein